MKENKFKFCLSIILGLCSIAILVITYIFIDKNNATLQILQNIITGIFCSVFATAFYVFIESIFAYKKAKNLIILAVCMLLILQSGFTPLISLADEAPAAEMTADEIIADEAAALQIEPESAAEIIDDIEQQEAPAIADDVPQQPEQQEEEVQPKRQ